VLRNEKMEVVIASHEDLEHVYVELMYEGEYWAAILQEQGELTFEVYKSNKVRVFNYDDVLEQITYAKKILLEEE
jgi:hypothetical protein